MKTLEFSGGDRSWNAGGTITYQEMVYVFNPTYIKVTGTFHDGIGNTKPVLSFECDGVKRDLPFELYNAEAKVFISNILQTFFVNPKSERFKKIKVTLSFFGISVPMYILCIWGGTNIGDRTNATGKYEYNGGSPIFTRFCKWFKNFPFSFTRLNHASELLYSYIIDGGRENFKQQSLHNTKLEEFSVKFRTAEETIDVLFSKVIPISTDEEEEGDNEETDDDNEEEAGEESGGDMDEETGVKSRALGGFEPTPIPTPDDSDYDYLTPLPTYDDTNECTFYNPCSINTRVHIEVSNEKNGYYLRWIDRFGNMNYYLFTKGDDELSVEHSEVSVNAVVPNSPIDYAESIRNIHTNGKHSVKCSAVNLNKELYDYVETILTSNIIDLYMGKNANREDVWLPVNLTGENTTRNAKQNLQDIEITIEFPQMNTQSL